MSDFNARLRKLDACQKGGPGWWWAAPADDQGRRRGDGCRDAPVSPKELQLSYR